MSMGAEQLITGHLDLWTAAIKRRSTAGRGSSKQFELYGVKKLRELILELAVRGLLVPQDPNDEPASELLKKIAAEKAKLIKEGQIKNGKIFPAVQEDKKPYALPAKWEWCQLGKIGNIFNGNSINASVKENLYTEVVGLPFIATKDVGYGFDDLDYQNGIYIPLEERGFRVARKEAVLICAEGGSAGKKCGITNQDICFGNKLFANELYGDINPRFILSTYLTPTFFSQLSTSMTGIIGGISSAKFSELLVPVAPVQEQHRIVAKVNALMLLCDQLEQQTDNSFSAHETLVETLLNMLTNAADHEHFERAWQRIAEHFDALFVTEKSIDRLIQAILYLTSNGTLVRFPEKSQRVHLKKILSFGPRNGFSPKESLNDKSTKVLKLGATSYGKLNLSQVKSFDEDVPTNSHLWLQRGDILIQRGNSHGFVGSNVLIDEDIENIIYPDLMMKLRVNGDALPGYISLLLSAPQARKHMWEKIENIPVIVPPIEIQEKVISYVRSLLEICNQLKFRLNDAQTTQLHLADALTKKALEGA
jgi:type I restriction enzyme, S subunit